MGKFREAMSLIDTYKVDGGELLNMKQDISHEHLWGNKQQFNLFLLNH